MKSRYASVAVAAGLLFVGLGPVFSAVATPAKQEIGSVVAEGLASPRGITAGPDGTLYVAESGSGGEQKVTIPLQGQPTEVGLGTTGRVSRIARDGTKSVLVSNLPSSLANGEATGPAGLIYASGALWLTTGGARVGIPARANEGAVLRVDPQSGATQSIASLQQYEEANNPDGFAIDSNPYGLALGPDGMLYVADAGGNALYKVNPAGGQPVLVTLFEGLPLPEALRGPGPFAQGNPARGGKFEMDPVPTGVTFDPNGVLNVGLLSGFPFLTGGAKLLSVMPAGMVSEIAGGFTTITDVELGPDNMLYVVEIGQFSLTGQPPGFVPNSGRVVRLMPDGGKDVIAGNLNMPNGIAFDVTGNLYVTTNSVSPTDGEVRYLGNRAAAVAGMPRAGAGSSVEYVAYLSLLLIAGGYALLRLARPAARKRELG